MTESADVLSASAEASVGVVASITESADSLLASASAAVIGAAVLNELSDEASASTLVSVLASAGFFELADIIEASARSRFEVIYESLECRLEGIMAASNESAVLSSSMEAAQAAQLESSGYQAEMTGQTTTTLEVA
jgi:hypothetical protein